MTAQPASVPPASQPGPAPAHNPQDPHNLHALQEPAPSTARGTASTTPATEPVQTADEPIAAPARSWLAYACIVVAAIVPLALSPIGPVPHWAIIQDRIAPLVWWFAMVTIGSVRAVDARADSPIHDNQLNAICSAALMLATLWLGFSWPADTAASWVAAALVWAACLFVVIGTRRTMRIWPALVLLIPAALPQLLGDLSLSAALVVAGLGLIWSAQHLARHPGSRLPAPRMQKLAPLVLSVVVLIAAVRWSWL